MNFIQGLIVMIVLLLVSSYTLIFIVIDNDSNKSLKKQNLKKTKMEKLLKTFSGISKKFDMYKEEKIKEIDLELREYRNEVDKLILEESKRLNVSKVTEIEEHYKLKLVKEKELSELDSKISIHKTLLQDINKDELISAKDKEIERLNQIILSMSKQSNIINK